jgi:hypothetical protein
MGIAFPFVFAATGLIYGLCIAPSIVFWSAGGRVRAPGIVATAVLVVFTALAPDYLGHYAADAAAAVLRAPDGGRRLKPITISRACCRGCCESISRASWGAFTAAA